MALQNQGGSNGDLGALRLPQGNPHKAVRLEVVFVFRVSSWDLGKVTRLPAFGRTAPNLNNLPHVPQSF